MGRNAIFRTALTGCFVLLTACGSGHYIQRGADLYSEGRFVEADEIFARSEPRLARAALEQQATYAAYRGATFVALGDLPHAHRWLSVASEIERTRPGTLRPEDRAFLDGAWRAYGNRLPPAPPATNAVASTSPGASPSITTVPTNTPVQERALVPGLVPQSVPQ
ncbi:MAG TPA: hypothetical protein VFK05_09225 [Polyangiaceae bacterium]|nr:hypothetical protein [Polyangiaceae bacterium]